ncbi:MAG: ATP-binding protein, partial [Firmicutes bacterium]|nr:ATP-binding protein [Bacillota bacterium]
MNKKSIYNQIENEYQKDRFAASDKAEKRKKEIYSVFPRIEEIDSLVEKNGIALLKAAFDLKEKDERNNFIEKIKVENDVLIAEKNYILVGGGYPKDYMTNVYKCPECRDSGRIGNEKCSCYYGRLMKKLYDLSNLGNKLDKENFENFDITFYSDKKGENEKLSPLENINNVLKICSKFIKEFENKNMNLIFYGGAGLGKTFLCSCIAKELIEKGKIVLYISAFELFDMIEREHFG